MRSWTVVSSSNYERNQDSPKHPPQTSSPLPHPSDDTSSPQIPPITPSTGSVRPGPGHCRPLPLEHGLAAASPTALRSGGPAAGRSSVRKGAGTRGCGGEAIIGWRALLSRFCRVFLGSVFGTGGGDVRVPQGPDCCWGVT